MTNAKEEKTKEAALPEAEPKEPPPTPKQELLKLATTIRTKLQELGEALHNQVLPAQGQSAMVSLAKGGGQQLDYLIAEIEGAADDCYQQVTEQRPAKEEEDAKGNGSGKVLRETETEQRGGERSAHMSGEHGSKPENRKAPQK